MLTGLFNNVRTLQTLAFRTYDQGSQDLLVPIQSPSLSSLSDYMRCKGFHRHVLQKLLCMELRRKECEEEEGNFCRYGGTISPSSPACHCLDEKSPVNWYYKGARGTQRRQLRWDMSGMEVIYSQHGLCLRLSCPIHKLSHTVAQRVALALTYTRTV